MKEKLEGIRAAALEAITAAKDHKVLEEARVKFLGRKGVVTDVLRGLADVAPEARRALGQAANEVKKALGEAIDSRKSELEEQSRAQRGRV